MCRNKKLPNGISANRKINLFSGRGQFFSSATLSQTETYPATVVTALLAGKAIFARILFRAFPGFFGDIHLALQSGHGYKCHESSLVMCSRCDLLFGAWNF
jgi:hypothetical protein